MYVCIIVFAWNTCIYLYFISALPYCDHCCIIGECSCFTGFGSSNGKSGSGTKRDCGFLEPLASISG